MEGDEVMEEDIRYEHSDSERSSSGRSSDPSSEDEEEKTPSSARRSPGTFTNEQARDEQPTRAAKEGHGGVSKKEPIGQLMRQDTAYSGTSESSVVAWIGRMQEQKGRVLQVARERPPKMGADSIPYKLTLLWMSGLTPPEVSPGITKTHNQC